MVTIKIISEKNIWDLLETIVDPEVPVLNIVDLGIVRKVDMHDGKISIIITPTYTGCPAMDVIKLDMYTKLLENGITNFEINTILSPAWTTDWMSKAGKKKLKKYGIAPPPAQQSICTPDAFQKEEAVQCPHCNSYRTILISRFGSTACKALYKCEDCREPFEYFKCH